MLECLIGHHRAEIRATNADVDDVLDALAGVALPRTRAHLLGKHAHPVERRVNLCNDVLTVDFERCVARKAQRRVEHRSVLRDIDVITAEHRRSAARKIALLCQLKEQRQGLGRDAILRVVQEQSDGLGSKRLAARWVIGELVAQVQAFDRGVVPFQSLPSVGGSQRCHQMSSSLEDRGFRKIV